MKLQRPPDGETDEVSHGGLNISTNETTKLGSLPIGARIILRCRADWRTATVASIEAERVVLNVVSPTGHTYRVRRPHDAPLNFDGQIPVLGEGSWRAGLARYDVRW
jgi:hypothetical protein